MHNPRRQVPHGAVLRRIFATALFFAASAGVCLALNAPHASSADSDTSRPELILYTYDSFVAEGGLGRAILPLFEKSCACKVRALASGDSLQMISRLELDFERSGGARGARRPDILLGVDLQSWGRVRRFVLEDAKGVAPLSGLSQLAPEVRVPEIKQGFVPYDYGAMAFMADMEQLRALKLEPPRTLRDLLKPEWKRNFIVEDPRTSAPGLGFALFARATLPNFAADVARLRAQWLTLAPGWDQAYGLFLRKEAPLVWSYVTSQAYHVSRGDASGRYRAVLFEEGQPLQIEGAALVRGVEKDPTKLALARKFLEFLLSAEAQAHVPARNWMMPARQGVKLPASFVELPRPAKTVTLPTRPEEIATQLREWSQALAAPKGSIQ